MTEKAQWYRLKLGVLPPEGVVIDAAMESKICNAIGNALGDWTVIYGFDVEVIPVAERKYPMAPKVGPFPMAPAP